jgi:diguanylate cyclase (GGDEF)-like protein/PAS domain S-box-containing protein
VNKILQIKDIMNTNLITASIESTFEEVLDLMQQYQISSVIIEQDKKPLGICTYLEVINAISKHKSKESINLIDAINKDIVSVNLYETAYKSYQKLLYSGKKHLIVVNDDNILEGIVTGSDLFKHTHYNEQIKFKTIFDLNPDTIIIIDPISLDIIHFNQQALLRLGYSKQELSQLKISDLDMITAPFYTQQGINNLEQYQHTTFETKFKIKNGNFIDVNISISLLNFENSKFIMIFCKDITQEKLYESKIENITNYDQLTGLSTQYLFKSYLKQILLKRDLADKFLAVLKIDIDDFGNINNSLGHQVGDEVLKLVANKLRNFFRKEDLIGRFDNDLLSRFGGDKFGVILEYLNDKEDLIMIASRIRDEFNNLVVLENGFELYLSLSIGISVVPYGSTTADELIDFADIALRNSKAHQKGSFGFYENALTKKAKEKLEMEVKLRQVVDNHELEVYYQPQVNISSGKIKGVEALVRWINKDGVIVSPASFIPVAEDVGCIYKIGRWVLHEACLNAKKWLDDGNDLVLSVNLSMQQILHDDIAEVIQDILIDTSYPAHQLELEITESGMMEDPERVIITLHKIKSLGVKIAIDDFGTGYSSLAYLKKFPIDILKIDKSFIDELPSDKDSITIVKTIIVMAQSLGYKTIAEGVENQEQLDFLATLGCDLYQGYLKSKPVNKFDFEKLLQEN